MLEISGRAHVCVQACVLELFRVQNLDKKYYGFKTALRRVLRRSWVGLGRCWGGLGRSWGGLGRFGGALGRSWRDLGAPKSIFQRSWLQKSNFQKNIEKPKEKQ